MPKFPDIFSFNTCGLGNHSKLLNVVNLCKKKASQKEFIICIQESKIKILRNTQKDIFAYNLLEYYLSPATNKSGGLIIIWTKTIQLKALKENNACQIMYSDQYDFFLCNTYLNKPCHQWKSALLQKTITDISPQSPLFIAGDLNCFDFNANNTSGQLRSFDPRISNFKNIEPLLRLYDLTDSAEKFGRMDFTHYDKTSRTFSRIDYIYTNHYADAR